MIKIFTAFFIFSFGLFSTVNAQQAPPRPMDECLVEAPWGFPQATLPTGHAICRMAYALLHDNRAKIPLWTVYTLTPERAMGCGKRSDAFQPDQSLPRGERAELADYRQSGYDTGHMVNSADMLWSITAERESFILSNMIPQNPSLNRGIWRQLEIAIRTWAVDLNNDFVVYTGPVYNYDNKTIGRNKVIVPHAVYKVVVNKETREIAAWVFPQTFPYQTRNISLTFFRKPLKDVQVETGIVFPIPTDGNELDLNRLWHIDSGKLSTLKTQVCGLRRQ